MTGTGMSVQGDSASFLLQLKPGPITDKSVLPIGSFVQSPMRYGRLFLGLNLAIAAGAYSDTAPRRVWRCEHFSWWMTTTLHTSGDPVDAQLQLSQLRSYLPKFSYMLTAVFLSVAMHQSS